MRSFSKAVVPSLLALVALAGTASNVLATNYPITWLNMAPVPLGSSVPNSSVYNLPGVGNVTITYSLPTVMTNTRLQNGFIISGNVTSGPDNFSWTNFESFATIFTATPAQGISLPWRITYTFPSTLPAGSIYLGVSGLGRTTSFGGGASIISCNQNSTFLGDWQGAGGPWGPTLYNVGPPFTMENSVTGAGGADPWWNTKLGIVRIDDATNSVTIDASQLRGDGVGLNIGYSRIPAGACPVDCPPQVRVPICYEAGRVDNYAAPVDPTTPRPFFQSLLSTYAISKPFDDSRVNAVSGTSFQNLPCGIQTATLVIQLRAENDIPQNDAIYLQWLGSGFTWASPINALPGAGGTWNAGQNVTFTIPLNAALLTQMNLTRALDVMVSDDTTIEHARLSITVCPCNGPVRVYTVGIADNLASPTEPTSRRPRLTALRTLVPFLWKDNDDCTFDRGWGNTFTNLPPGIVRADFNISMKPCGGSNNDGLNFDLLNLGAPETFSRNFNINLLPGSGGTWNTNLLTNFYFNLGATMPTTVCGSNLLGDFGDRTFDVYVQDDTAIDVARLRVLPCPPLRHVWGNPVLLTGSAQLSLDPAGRWMVENLAGSGNDGVQFDAHGSEGQNFKFAPGTFQSYPPGTEVTMHLGRAPWSGSDGDDVCEETVIFKGRITSLNVMRVTPHIGTNVHQPCTGILLRNSQTGQSLQACLLPGEDVEVFSTNVSSMGWHASSSVSGLNYQKIEWDFVGEMRLPNGETFAGDSLELEVTSICPESPIETCSFSWGVTEEGQSGGPLSAGFTALSTTVNGVAHQAVGPEATINPNKGSLTVSNIGSSGEDGVTLQLGEAESFSVDLSPPYCGSDEDVPCDGVIQQRFTATGTFSDGTSRRVVDSHAIRTHMQGFFDIFADFGDEPGTPPRNVIATILNAAGDPVGSIPVIQGTALRCAQGKHIKKARLDVQREATSPASQIAYTFETEATFSVPGLPPIVGKTVSLTVMGTPGGTATVQSLSSFTLTGSGMSEIDLTNHQIVPVGSGTPCYADFDQSGGVDGSDVDAFFAAWVNGDAAADVDQSGGIDGADVDLFFVQWSNGGC